MNYPFLSFIVPIYNTERFLPRCLDSILSQNYPNLEIICVDDHSGDASAGILQHYAKKHSSIKVFSTCGKGVADTRNTGLIQAKGEWIGFVDSDDFLLPNALQEITSYLTEDIDLMVWGYELYFETQSESRVPERANICKDEKLYFKGKKNFSFRIARHTPVVLWNKLFRADIIRERHIAFPRDVSFGEDNAFFWKYFLYCRKAYFLPKALYAYVQHSASLMNRLEKRHLPKQDTHMQAAEDIYHFYQLHRALPSHAKELEKICLWVFYFLWEHTPVEKKADIFQLGVRFFRQHSFNGRNAAVQALLRGNMGEFLKIKQKGSLLEQIFSFRNINGYKSLTLFGVNIPLYKK